MTTGPLVSILFEVPKIMRRRPINIPATSRKTIGQFLCENILNIGEFKALNPSKYKSIK